MQFDPEEEPIAAALEMVALQLSNLGNGNAATSMGAIEAHSVQVREGLDAIAGAIGSHTEAVDRLADAVSRLNKDSWD